MKFKFKQSIILSLGVLIVGTGCSRNNSNAFTGSNKSRVLKTSSNQDTSKILDDKEFNAAYSEETEKFLDFSMEEVLDKALSEVEKILGSDSVTINGVEYEDPARQVADVIERIQDSNYDPYTSPRELMEDAELTVDLTNKKEVEAYLEEEKVSLTETREVLAEIDMATFKLVGPEAEAASEESLSLLQCGAGSKAVGDQVKIVQGNGECSVSAVSNGTGAPTQVLTPQGQTTAATGYKKPAAKNNASAKDSYVQAQVPVLKQIADSEKIVKGFPQILAEATKATNEYAALGAKKTGMYENFDVKYSEQNSAGSSYESDLNNAVNIARETAAASITEAYNALGIYFTP